ncbi:MAG: 4Fe-4S dicluster domain-containing protein [Planctomycetota bacterium]|jgi:2-oxoglutarate ferredoxin oxidoreductase subunit delta
MSDTDEKKPPKKKKFRGEVYIEKERCKGCAFCVEFCPTDTLILSKEFNAKGYHPPEIADIDSCTGCGLCGMYCPDFAIFGIRIRIEGADTEAAKKADLVSKNED